MDQHRDYPELTDRGRCRINGRSSYSQQQLQLMLVQVAVETQYEHRWAQRQTQYKKNISRLGGRSSTCTKRNKLWYWCNRFKN